MKNQGIDLAAPIREPFRALPRWAQWLFGPIIIWSCMSEYARHLKPPPPGDPVLGIWVTLLLFVLVVVLNELLRPEPRIEEARPKGLGDFKFPTATEGRVVPIVFGRVWIEGPNVVWYGDLEQIAIREKIKTGLWSSKTFTKGFEYRLGIQFALCRGPGVVLKRVFIGEQDAFGGTVVSGGRFDIDDVNLFGGNDMGNGGMQTTCDFYGGESTQVVNAYLDTAERQRIVSAATPTAPRYTGTCHIVARELTSVAPTATDRGAYLGNSTTIKVWKFEVERFPVAFSSQSAGQNKIGTKDCNPINVIHETMVNDEWGFNFPDSDIDLAGTFKDASDVMITESNGWSLLIDRSLKAAELIREVQRQIDGVVFLDQRTGTWKIQLARGPSDPKFGYDIDTVPQFTDATVTEVRDFTRSSWEDTTNQIAVRYDKRDDDYKLSYALAQDGANAQIQGGGTVLTATTVSAETIYPGIKESALAVNIAWRDLRGHSYPLARASFIVNRSFWDLVLGEVIAWTSPALKFVKLPMRITRIDYGKLDSNKMTVQAVQDVFEFAAASYGPPPPTGWNPPAITLVAVPATQQTAFEAPRGILIRDPEFGNDDAVSKVLASTRRQTLETAIKIKQRNDPVTPAGSFADAGDVFGFMLIGQLKSSLATGTVVPTPTITITATPDSQLNLETAFIDASTPNDLGSDLVQLVKVGTEFMLVQKAANNASDVDLQNVYRGVLDSAQQTHAAGTDVFLLFNGSGMTDTIFPNTNKVDIELRMRSSTKQFTGSVTTIALTMAKRPLRPYPPADVSIDGTRYSGAVSLEGSGAGLDGFRNDYTWLRRDFRAGDEVAALTNDGGGTLLLSNEYQVELRADPDVADNLIGTSTFLTSSSPAVQFLRKLILHYSPNGAAGAKIRCIIRARHDYKTETNILSRQNLIYDFTPTSALTTQFALGSLAATVVSAQFTAPATGSYPFAIGTAFSTSNVEAQINGGGFAVIIAATATTGTLAGVTASDIIEVRHTVNDSGARTFLEVQNPSAVAVTYAVLHAGQAAS